MTHFPSYDKSCYPLPFVYTVGGNKGFCKDPVGKRIVPVIFDPASYYGDREVDIAMTYLFGGFNNDFYNGYNNEWKLPQVR